MQSKKIQAAKTKKAQGHIEMILSLVIFVGFVAAIFLFLNPLSQQTVTEAAFSEVQEKIINNLSVNYNYIGLILAGNLPAGTLCFSVDASEAGISEGSSIIVKDLNNKLMNSSKSAGKINIEYSPGVRFYGIYSSRAFNNYPLTSGSCLQLTPANYSFGASGFEKAVLYENLVAMNSAYLADYESLKKSLAVKDDFDFIVSDLARNVLLNETITLHKLRTSSVLSRELPLKASDKNASQVSIIFNLRVW